MSEENNEESNQYEFEKFEGADDVDEEVIDHIRGLADIHFSEGRNERALEVFEKLVRFRPDRAEFWRDMGITARTLDRNHYALFCLQKALKRDEDDRLTQLNLGEVLIRVGKPTEGLKVLEHVFREGRDPDKEPEEQDDLTKRAGAVLGSTYELADELELLDAQ